MQPFAFPTTLLSRLIARPAAPNQRALATLLTKTTRVRVLAGGVAHDRALGNQVLLECTDKAALVHFRAALTIIDNAPAIHYAGVGDQAIELYAGTMLLATFGLHHGHSVRWATWAYDAILRDGGVLLGWLAAQGVTEPLEQWQNNQLQSAIRRWRAAMPSCLQPFWSRMERCEVPVTEVRSTLIRAIPDASTRILALLTWFGSGVGLWSYYPQYEQIAEALLCAEQTEVLITTLETNASSLTAAQIDGTARLVSALSFRSQRAIVLRRLPRPLRTQLSAAARNTFEAET